MHTAAPPLLQSAAEIANSEYASSIAFACKRSDYPVPPAGREAPPESPLKVKRDDIVSKVHRIALTTLEGVDAPLPADVANRCMGLIREELKPLGWDITETNEAFRALELAPRTGCGLYDPITGILNTAQLAELRKSVFAHIGLTPSPDAILYVQNVQSAATHHFGDVEWDGVSQSAINLGPVRKAMFGGSGVPLVGDGGVKTLSLRFQLRDASDTLLYDGRGGVQLLQGKKPTDLAPSEIFNDPAREQPAVHAGLRDLVLTPEAIAKEAHP